MGFLASWQQALFASWAQVWTSFLSVLPSILGAIVIFAVGLALAYWAKRLILEGLKLVRFEKVSGAIGADKYLSKADIRLTLIELLGTFVEWIIILVFFLAAVDILGLTAVSQVLAMVLSYLPNVIAAALIFATGYVVAGLAEALVRGALASVNHEAAKPIGKMARWVIMLVAVFAGLDQLKIAQGLIATFFQGLTYTVVLVVGLSVGLGAKDVVGKILNDWYDKFRN